MESTTKAFSWSTTNIFTITFHLIILVRCNSFHLFIINMCFKQIHITFSLLTQFHRLLMSKTKALSRFKKRNRAHLEYLLLTMPSHPSILHQPFLFACKDQWSVSSPLTVSGGRKLSAFFSFSPGQQLVEVSPFFCRTPCSPWISKSKMYVTLFCTFRIAV